MRIFCKSSDSFNETLYSNKEEKRMLDTITSITQWIESVLINGYLASAFQWIMNVVLTILG